MVTDHLGNEYSSIAKIALAYDINYQTLMNRVNKGWPLDKALTIPAGWATTVKDHLGNTYKSFTDMCEAYGKNRSTVMTRMRSGYTLKEALEYGEIARIESVDHKGIHYASIQDMVDSYGIRLDTFKYRINNGWSLQRALEEKVTHYENPTKDHLGKEYKSFLAMCNAYGQSKKTVKSRMEKQGKTLEEALTEEPMKHRKTATDHLGVTYKTFTKMCRAYNIEATKVRTRLSLGWTLEEALVIGHRLSNVCTDHLGGKHESFRDMCIHFGKDSHKAKEALKRGKTLEEVLTSKTIATIENTFEIKVDIRRLQVFGIKYSNISEITSTYGILDATFKNRISRGIEPEVAILMVCPTGYKRIKSLTLAYIGINNKAYYTINKGEAHTTREIIALYRPDLIRVYDEYNPIGEYRPYVKE